MFSDILVNRSMCITFNDRLQRESKLKPFSLPCSLEADVIFLSLCNVRKLYASVAHMAML